MLSSYLRAECGVGRLLPDADADALAFTLIGTGHLLFAGELGGLPDTDAIEEIVESIIVGGEPGIAPNPHLHCGPASRRLRNSDHILWRTTPR
jgi:hypothetical protein